MPDKILLKSHLDTIIKLFRDGHFEQTLKEINNLLADHGNEPFLYNLKGMTEIKTSEFKLSIESFNNAIKLKPEYVEAFNNMSTSYINIGEFDKAIFFLKKAIKLRPDYINAYNNLASVLNDQGNYEESIKTFDKLLKIDSNYPGVKENIIKILTFYEPKNKNLNIFTKLNDLLKNININNELLDKDIIDFYKKCNEVVLNKLDDLEFNFSQIWRRNKIDLNCARHFDVFRNFNVIPEFCFSCFKVQIELCSLIDLFRLYFLFDKLKLDENKSRKTIIEMRTIGKGNYKGLIYCSGIDEARTIHKKLNNLTQNFFTKYTNIKLRRGCTEFGNSYPDYKNIDRPADQFMKFKEEWKDKEMKIDEKLPTKNRINQRVLKDTIQGITLNDFLIMKNWIMYAKQIDDHDYKKFDSKIKVSEYMEKNLSDQLSYRKNEFKNFSLLSK